MMSLVYLALLRLQERGAKAETIFGVMGVFSRMYRALCEGQYMDIAFEGRPYVSLEEYLSMIQRKTASLIAASTQIGAMLATEDQDTIQALRRFGENLGLAFQVVDDVLGTWGTPEATGKPVANDIRRRKKTLPVVYALGKESEAARELAELYARDEVGEVEITRILELLELCGAREYCQERAAALHRAGAEALEMANLPDAQARSELEALAQFLLERDY
jgi:geranylgeranyl diphosphate synthase type I